MKKDKDVKIDKISLNINTHIICFLILKAREFQAKEGVSFPEKIKDSENEYDWAQILADHQDDLTFLEVKKVISDLEPDQQIELLALMYIGRGDFEMTEWKKALKEAEDTIEPNLAEYLFAKPQLPEYYEHALEILGFNCEDFNY